MIVVSRIVSARALCSFPGCGNVTVGRGATVRAAIGELRGMGWTVGRVPADQVREGLREGSRGWRARCPRHAGRPHM